MTRKPQRPSSLPVTQSLRSAALEDCVLCQETLSSSELAAKTCDGDFEGVWEAGAGACLVPVDTGSSGLWCVVPEEGRWAHSPGTTKWPLLGVSAWRAHTKGYGNREALDQGCLHQMPPPPLCQEVSDKAASGL